MFLDLQWPYCDPFLPAYFRNVVAEIGMSPAGVEDDEAALPNSNVSDRGPNSDTS